MTVLPRDHAWTVQDLASLPDDGLRYELVDGTLLVSPAPTKSHQRAVEAPVPAPQAGLPRASGGLPGPHRLPAHLDALAAAGPARRRPERPGGRGGDDAAGARRGGAVALEPQRRPGPRARAVPAGGGVRVVDRRSRRALPDGLGAQRRDVRRRPRRPWGRAAVHGRPVPGPMGALGAAALTWAALWPGRRAAAEAGRRAVCRCSRSWTWLDVLARTRRRSGAGSARGSCPRRRWVSSTSWTSVTSRRRRRAPTLQAEDGRRPAGRCRTSWRCCAARAAVTDRCPSPASGCAWRSGPTALC